MGTFAYQFCQRILYLGGWNKFLWVEQCSKNTHTPILKLLRAKVKWRIIKNCDFPIRITLRSHFSPPPLLKLTLELLQLWTVGMFTFPLSSLPFNYRKPASTTFKSRFIHCYISGTQNTLHFQYSIQSFLWLTGKLFSKFFVIHWLAKNIRWLLKIRRKFRFFVKGQILKIYWKFSSSRDIAPTTYIVAIMSIEGGKLGMGEKSIFSIFYR